MLREVKVIVVRAGCSWLALLCALLLSACSSTPPIEMTELVEQGNAHWSTLQADYDLVSQPLTLERALVLGVERNIDFRLKALEAALATSNKDLASVSMLPSLTAAAGYTYRDRVAGSFSESISTGQVSLEPSTSLDNRRLATSLEATWNVLDFAMAWHRSKALNDQVRVAEEQRVRMLHSISREIVYAWDMLRAYQRIAAAMENAKELLVQAIDRSDLLESRRLQDPVLILDYRRSLLLLQQQLNRMHGDMRIAQDELARLLNLPAGAPIRVDDSHDPLNTLPDLSAPLGVWQRMGLLNRPEVRSAFYEKRIADRGAMESVLQSMPGVALRYGVQTDSNSYALNNRWQEGGVQLSWNLMQLASYPARRRQAELQRDRAELSAELQMTAVISQVVIAGKQLQAQRENACLAIALEDVESRRVAVLRSRQLQAAIDRLTVIRAVLDHTLMKLEAELYQVEQRRALLSLLSSAGLGVLPDVIDEKDPEQIELLVRNWMEAGIAEKFEALRAEVVSGFENIDPAGDMLPGDQSCLSVTGK